MAQWEAFLKKCPYSGYCKSRPSGSALPTAPPTLPLSASAFSEAGRPAPPHRPPTPPSEGCGRSGESEGVLRVGSREVSSPPSRRSVGEGGGGSWLLGARLTLLILPLKGGGVAGSSCSQESLVLAAPSSVASSAFSEHGHRSHCHEIGDFTEDRSRSRSS